MGSDRARISFDPTRDYRSVVAQQGRVTLEADVNEQSSIASEAVRLETIDIVGPVGTPDDGYKVSVSGGDLIAGTGTMYVGGWRLHSTDRVELKHQPDWLDRPLFDRVLPALVALLVTEQSVSATEDQALREVALGGPDTAARTRLMQHFLELPTKQLTCDAAAKDLKKNLAQIGLLYDEKTAELFFNAKLKVSFFPPTTPQDPCCPPAQGGYLGADNQLVQVTVASYDATAGTGTLLWGWNNASFLYRATLLDPKANPPILKLGQAPVDAEHTPQAGQVIEVLRTESVLGHPPDKNYVAAPQGLVVTLGSGTVFDPSSNQLTLPAGTVVPNDPRSLFVRLWQAEVPFTSGKAQQLDSASGLAVTVKIKALPTGQWLARPFWEFAVRPNTPQQVYPQRYLQAGSAPDGPRQWLCDLAIVEAIEGARSTPHDCRKHFVPLTELERCTCCNLVLDPSQDWLGTLNEALASNATALSVCFQPGEFKVANKITISGKSVKMTGAGSGTTIVGDSLEVVLEFDNCPSLELSDLSVTAGTAGYSNNPATAGLQGAVTVRSCNQVDIERVFLACADADLRSASCLLISNPAPSSNNLATAPQYNVRVLNSEFNVGHFQVGILLVNADRAQVEGNLIVTPQKSRNLTIDDLSKNPATAARLQKQLVYSLLIKDTAPPATKKARAKLQTQQKAEATLAVKADQMAKKESEHPLAAQPASATAPAGTSAPATSADQLLITNVVPRLNLGTLGLGHVTATFGTVKLQFISSDKLGIAWKDALNTAGLTATSGVGAVYKAVQKIAKAIVKTPAAVAPAFRAYLNATLPLLYSTSSQGIVVGGDVAKDIRILNNTISGTAQGIHVGLNNMKTKAGQHLQAERVQICGNTITVRVTPETTGDRHGIYLGCVNSAIINDNQLELSRASYTQEPKYAVLVGAITFAIKVAGVFGPRLLIERNCMQNFNNGILTVPYLSQPSNVLWKAADNASPSGNDIKGPFITVDNINP